MLKVGLYTLGCKVSQYETEAIGEAFVREGFEIADFSEVCDAYIINTCTVTEESDRKSRQFIRRAVRKNPEAVVAALGCYTQRAPDEVAKIDGVSVVIGTQDKLTVVERVKELLEKRKNALGSNTTEEIPTVISVGSLDCASFEQMTVKSAPRTRAYVKIEDGCESKCTYCAIAPARGPVRSKAPADVIAEVEGLSKGGTLEIVLTGIETGSYGKDFAEKYTLADLLTELDRRGSATRIRLGSLAPELMGKEFVEKTRGIKILTPHFHISMQSGSDSVLRAMKRRYNSEMAYENIMRLKDAFSGAMFTTDLMVGFPGESEEDFLETVNFLRRVGFLDAHIFAYSKREGTPAAQYENQIPEPVKRRRSEELIRVKCEVRDKLLSEVVAAHQPLSCILESEKDGCYTAHSDSFIEVSLEYESGNTGKLLDVIPLCHKDGVIYGKALN